MTRVSLSHRPCKPSSLASTVRWVGFRSLKLILPYKFSFSSWCTTHALPLAPLSVNPSSTFGPSAMFQRTHGLCSLEQELSSSLLVCSTFDTKESSAHIWVFLRLLENNRNGLGSSVHLHIPGINIPPLQLFLGHQKVEGVLVTVHKSQSWESLRPEDLFSKE